MKSKVSWTKSTKHSTSSPMSNKIWRLLLKMFKYRLPIWKTLSIDHWIFTAANLASINAKICAIHTHQRKSWIAKPLAMHIVSRITLSLMLPLNLASYWKEEERRTSHLAETSILLFTKTKTATIRARTTRMWEKINSRRRWRTKAVASRVNTQTETSSLTDTSATAKYSNIPNGPQTTVWATPNKPTFTHGINALSTTAKATTFTSNPLWLSSRPLLPLHLLSSRQTFD